MDTGNSHIKVSTLASVDAIMTEKDNSKVSADSAAMTYAEADDMSGVGLSQQSIAYSSQESVTASSQPPIDVVATDEDVEMM